MTDPEAAADELERGVRDLGLCGALINGTAGGLFLDDAAFAPLLARAASLAVPLYLHPSLPPNAVLDASYGDLPGHAGFLLAGPGFGWPAETAIPVLRLVLAGDRKTVVQGTGGSGRFAFGGRRRIKKKKRHTN